MEYQHPERRKETRYPIETNVAVRMSSGETIHATAVNISSSGMLLHVEQPDTFSVDQEVSVEVELPDDPGKPFSAWGVARIVRVEDCGFGIHLRAGTFGNQRSPEV
jgi:hypothetical protein